MTIRRKYAMAAMATVAVGALAYTVVLRERRAPLTFAIPLADLPYRSMPSGSLAVSADGSRVAYVSGDPAAPAVTASKLVVWRSRDFSARAVPGTIGASGPFFSPDGRWLGFAADGALKKIQLDAAGGAPATICHLDGDLRGASWASDDQIYFAVSGGLQPSPIARVPAAGGDPRPVVTSAPGERDLRWPVALPDGRTVLYTAVVPPDGPAIYSLDLVTGQRRRVVEGESAQYASSGQLVFVTADGLSAAPYDLVSGQLGAGSAAIAPAPHRTGTLDHFAVSLSGTVVVAPRDIETRAGQAELVWISRTGVRTPVGPPPAAYRSVSLSPDGRRIAFQVDGTTCSTALYDLVEHTTTPLPFAPICSLQVWTPDGTRLTYRCLESGRDITSICWAPVDGRGDAEVLLHAASDPLSPKSWSGDGRVLTVQSGDTGLLVWTRGDSGGLRPILTSQKTIDVARISWNGDVMAYAVSEGGPPELYVAQYPDLSDRVRVSKGGGGAPHWRRDGRELFFRQGTTQGRFFVALISTTPALTASPPALLFYGPYDGIFDVTADGRQVLGIYRPPMSEQPHLTVLDLPRVSSQ